jgi:hypothetical protein
LPHSTTSTTGSMNTETALTVLNILFDKTKNNSYFNKIIFGSKQKFKN